MSGRIRTIKPEILDDENTATLSDKAYRLFLGLIVEADDHGNVRAGAGFLHARIFWGCPGKGPEEVDTALSELANAGLVRIYTVRGQRYLAMSGWKKHQRIDNAGKARVPGPEEGESEEFAEVRGEIPRNSANVLSSINLNKTVAAETSDLRPPNRTPTTDSEHTAPRHENVAEPEASKTVLVFRCHGKPSEWALTEAYVAELSEAYPQTDILAEARKAHAWIEANGRKTAKGMPKFLVNWLSRCVDRPAGSPMRSLQRYQSRDELLMQRALDERQRELNFGADEKPPDNVVVRGSWSVKPTQLPRTG